jgi:hypothetical protein
MLLVAEPSQTIRTQYKISTMMDPFVPSSSVMTIHRGVDNGGTFVGEFE